MQIPDQSAVAARIMELLDENVDAKEPLRVDAPLINVLGLDSLDIIELGFSIQETFDFEFSDKNAVEELDKVLGGGRVLRDGRFTELGFRMLRDRMPELGAVDLPAELTVHQLQGYYTVETFARLICEFYSVIPKVHPETGEAVVIKDFRVLTESGGTLRLPKGDDLVDRWVEETALRLQQAD